MGAEGAGAAGASNGAGADQDMAPTWATQAWETKWHGSPCEVGADYGRAQQHAYTGAWASTAGVGVQTLAPFGRPDTSLT
jgi:hypothetical protein